MGRGQSSSHKNELCQSLCCSFSVGSVCYVTSGTPTTCTGRKRRSIKIDGAQLADVKPSQLNQEVQSSQKEAEKHREGRFLLYWITTTSISTSTSYTTTISVSAIECTRSDTTLCG